MATRTRSAWAELVNTGSGSTPSSRRGTTSTTSGSASTSRKPLSSLEAAFLLEMSQSDLPQAQREYRFHPERKWRFDFAWPERKVAVECEGGIWKRGRHVHPVGYLKDCEKYNAAALLGWRVFRFTRESVKSAAPMIAEALK